MAQKNRVGGASPGFRMGKTRSRRRANQTAIETKSRPVRSASSPSAQILAPGSPPSLARSAFSRRALWVSLALIAANLIVYAQVWNHDFVNYDDPDYVTANPIVSDGLTRHGVSWAFTTVHSSNWHPLTWLSHMLDVQLYGLNPGPHHLTSLLFHMVNTLLLFWLLHRMTAALGRSAFVAGLFAVHPLHVESVAWVAERKDVLSTLLGLLTICAYVAYVRQPRVRRYCLVLLLFALGLMAKPMLVTLPLVLLLLDFWPLRRIESGPNPPGGAEPRRDWRLQTFRLVLEKLPLLGLAAASSIVTLVAQRRGGSVTGLEKLPLKFRAASALVSYAAYIGKMLWPARLAVFYPYPRTLPAAWVVGALLGLLGISVAVMRAGLRHPYLPVGWLWYLGTMVPVIGLVQVGSQLMADRYTYVPLIGLFIMVAWGIPELVARWRPPGMVLPAAAFLAILACMLTAWGQVQYWQNSSTLWEHAQNVTTGNYLAYNNSGVTLAKQGKMDQAILAFSEALRIEPGYADVHNNLGKALASQGRLGEAIAEYSDAVSIKPGFAEAHYNMGNALADQGRTDEAIAQYSQALRIKPDFPGAHDSLGSVLDSPEAHDNLGVALAKQGKVDEAIGEFREALRIKPDDPVTHNNLGIGLAKQGKMDEAIHEFQEAVRIQPDYAEAHNNLGYVLASQGRVDQAIAQYSEVLRIAPDFPEARRSLNELLTRAKSPNPAVRNRAAR